MRVKWLGRKEYQGIWNEMLIKAQNVAAGESSETIWLCEHEPVYTTGRRGADNSKGGALPAPVVRSDRGGEMTFHGPGQLMLYPVIDLRRRGIGVKQYVHILEQSCLGVLRQSGVDAKRSDGFPGVWTEHGKIAALGVRVSHGVAYHGMALNVDVAADWFAAINPCGLQASAVSMSDFIHPQPLPVLAQQWQACFLAALI